MKQTNESSEGLKQSLQLYKNSCPGVKVFSKRGRGAVAWAGICHPQWKESLQSRNVTMESDPFIVAQGYQDELFI